jgi:hypothetical protein
VCRVRVTGCSGFKGRSKGYGVGSRWESGMDCLMWEMDTPRLVINLYVQVGENAALTGL